MATKNDAGKGGGKEKRWRWIIVTPRFAPPLAGQIGLKGCVSVASAFVGDRSHAGRLLFIQLTDGETILNTIGF